ncbi:TPA: excinuclease ABC subunit UvrB [Candidatus Poribacteria bacterium]|nr:excinuclease ABC subunit UvrB [Candidatus Poribacteria bacterium]HIB90584.1 excinuclease ABC subunit UvrB [Candidatus Poribacteria bacterium]HIC01817.1 excinuclease ABC subunit UvrB [Candidatus Poribacteria bacterium]HIC02604.1 excinuclease ABC subunit UvrB [Candidatus Poribacteria bacterium]HIC16591.1 excinuclease ABC subunit UvrB [Candidatus Poribacteria bacterium]
MEKFELVSDYLPQGDQPQAIDKLTKGLLRGNRFQSLLGVTGSGKTFTIANIIQNVQRPTLVISPNKTLAAQLYNEFRGFFPNNAVHYFVSYYDYYRPEAYIPTTDFYVEKEVDINEEINRLRLASTAAVLSRHDVVTVASISCIYGLGDPEIYRNHCVEIEIGDIIRRRDLLRMLVDIQYERNEVGFSRGNFRAKGDVIEVFPAYTDVAYRIELFGDEIDRMIEIDTLTGEILTNHDRLIIFPAKHFMTEEERVEQALLDIEVELQEQIEFFRSQDKLLEAQRIEQRTRYDLEMIRETGYCQGIENYSRHFTGLKVGEPPYCLVNYFPDDLLIIIDESHVTVPQIHGMYKGDRSRKKTLVNYGFRLPSALDNRPLRYEEFEALVNQVIFVSATPGSYELEHSNQVVEQIIRPTGLIDPKVSIHPVTQQVDHLIGVAKERITNNQRVLVTTLTKQTAEDLSEYFIEVGIKANYLHSDINTLERAKILKELREGVFDVLIGINLLREGLDLPEVSLVAVLDADQAGFLRSKTSLIQTAGRAARNVEGEVILYADNLTPAIEHTISETKRRRKIQMAYNEANNITPETIQKVIRDMIDQTPSEEMMKLQVSESPILYEIEDEDQDTETLIAELKVKMQKAAIKMKFEEAAIFRDQIAELEAVQK